MCEFKKYLKMPKDGKDKSKDKLASKPVASQDGDSDIEEEQIKVS